MKISILTAAAALGGEMIHIAIASLVIIALEAAIFITALTRAGVVDVHKVRGTLLRIAIACASALLAAGMTGLAWKPVPMAAVPALGWGGLLGGVVVLVFGITQFACWTIAGKPDGPEARLLGIFKEILRPMLARFDGVTTARR